jgi:anti-anti-sigma factor
LDELARIELDDDGPARLVRLSGEVDISNSSDLERRLLELTDEDGFVLDLSGLTYLDSAGVRLLFRLAEAACGRLRLVLAPDSPVRRVLELAGAERLLPLDGLSGTPRPPARRTPSR